MHAPISRWSINNCDRIKSCLPTAQIIYTSLSPNNLQIQYFKFKIKPIKNHNLNKITNGFRENFPEMSLIVCVDLSDIMAMVINHGYDILDGLGSNVRNCKWMTLDIDPFFYACHCSSLGNLVSETIPTGLWRRCSYAVSL